MAYVLSDYHIGGVPSLKAGMDAPEQWQTRREEILSKWLEYVGDLPEIVSPPRYEILAESKFGDYRRQHLRYSTAHEDWVTAYLLIPGEDGGQVSGNSRRYPAVMALHPANVKGKDDVANEDGRPNSQYGIELVKRGYVVLAPDTIQFGERVSLDSVAFYKQHPNWSTVGKMLTDHRYGLDLLSSLHFVDVERIGAIGQSLGGYNSYFLAGIDRRIRAVVCSCGFCPFAGDPRPQRWGPDALLAHLPRIANDLEKGIVPFDFHEIAALSAPTPAFFYNGQTDSVFPHWKHIAEALGELKRLYELLEPGKEDQLFYAVGSGGHVFHREMRELAYRFLDRHLRGETF